LFLIHFDIFYKGALKYVINSFYFYFDMYLRLKESIEKLICIQEMTLVTYLLLQLIEDCQRIMLLKYHQILHFLS
jgi:hypothetical protein